MSVRLRHQAVRRAPAASSAAWRAWFRRERVRPSIRDRLCSSSTRALRSNSVSGSFRSEEHTSELQSRGQLVCRLLLEKKTGHPIPDTPWRWVSQIARPNDVILRYSEGSGWRERARLVSEK